jgi:hypothetical protein
VADQTRRSEPSGQNSMVQDNGLPALTSLVVQEATGLPAPGFTAVSRSEIPDEQKRVWDYDWFAILPPTVEELKT